MRSSVETLAITSIDSHDSFARFIRSVHSAWGENSRNDRLRIVHKGQRVALTGVVISALLAVAKIVTGAISGSSALLADGFESAGDVLASGLVWLGLTWAAKPADENHPYGHGRAETISGLVVGLLLLCGGLAIAIEAFLNVGPANRVPAGYAVWPLAVSIVVKLWMMRLKYTTARSIGSNALMTDAMNDTVDTFSGVLALSALALTLYDPVHFLHFDHYGAGAVGMIMVLAGARAIFRTGQDLMDTQPENDLLNDIREIARGVAGVDGVEKVFARKTGLRHHVDLHLEVNPAMTVRQSHLLGHAVESAILEQMRAIADVLVHIEPSVRAHAETTMTKLADTTLNLADLKPSQEPFGELRMYFEGKTDQLKSMIAGSIVLAPGASPHPPHLHEEEEFMLVASGTGEIVCGDHTTQVGPGAMMYCAGDKLHGIINTGSTPMLFYFYKWLA
jgi:cation diffusion facilitator family transporter